MADPRPVITPEDREAAQDLVVEWTSTLAADSHLSTMCQLELLGMITAALADARWAGYAAGQRVGRQSQAQAIRELLELGGDL